MQLGNAGAGGVVVVQQHYQLLSPLSLLTTTSNNRINNPNPKSRWLINQNPPRQPLSLTYCPRSNGTNTDTGTETGEVGWYWNDEEEVKRVQFRTEEVEVMQLQELSENWRRSKLAWLCKELPSHKKPTISRLLTAHKKWIRQPDATYLTVHSMRVRQYEPAFWIYKWMIQQHWFHFDFALATKLADYMGREKKFSRAREIFDDIINQGRVPSESTFHILTVAYLSAPGEDCLREACEIYNRMIHLGGYRPLLSLHNALFSAIVSKPASSAKQYLKQAEFVFHNLVTCGLEIHKDIYGGLLWLHSYQDIPDKERILSLQEEMYQQGIGETRDTLLSILRACSKEGDLDEAEKTWIKLLKCEGGLPPQAYLYKMQVHAVLGDFKKSLKVFRDMQEQSEQVSVVAYQKIIEVMCNAQEVELAESLMKELIRSDLKPLTPSCLDLLNMYHKLRLHDKVELTFFECLQRCRPNRSFYSIYLDSLVQNSNIIKAESIFSEMVENDAVGVSARCCNTLLSGYLLCGDHTKAEKMYGFMCDKNYEVEASLMEKLELILSKSKKVVPKPAMLKLSGEQREILVGLLLGGLRVDYAEKMKNHFVRFEFKQDSDVHFVLKRHIYNKFQEWVESCNSSTDDDNIPSKFWTVPHTAFDFYSDQFRANGRQSIPKLIHRWLTPRALAYWFMYGGYRRDDGSMVLKLKGSKEDVESVMKALKMKSLEFRVKQKGKVFWVGFVGSEASRLWGVIEAYMLDELLEADAGDEGDWERGGMRFGSGCDCEGDVDGVVSNNSSDIA